MSILVERPNTHSVNMAEVGSGGSEASRREAEKKEIQRQLNINLGINTNDNEADQENGDGSRSETHARKHNNPLVRLLLKLAKVKEPEKKKDITLDMLQPSRYKPNDLHQMAEDTKFTKREVRSLYRAFKQECPNGIVDEETFKEVYEKIFPLGDATHYAHLVFSAIDKDKTGGITFGDFMEFLSVISKGSMRDKLMWTFQFYDVNRDGVISMDEMLKVTESIHELMGVTQMGVESRASTREHVERIFATMDLNRDGNITIEEFMTYCDTQQDVRNSLAMFVESFIG